MPACPPLIPVCGVKKVFGKAAEGVTDAVAGSAIEKLAEAVATAVGDSLASLGTLWVNVGTPNLTTGESRGRNAGATPPGASQVEQVLSWMMWLGFAVCVASLMVAGARLAFARRGSMEQEGSRVGVILLAAIGLGAASALVGAIFRGGRGGGGGGTVAFLQNSLWYYVMVLAVISIIVAAIKMAWDQRGDAGRDVVRSLLTLIVISAAAIPVIGILIEASDRFSEWIINGALDCSAATGDGSCFSRNIGSLITIGSVGTAGSPLAPMMVIIMGIVAVGASVIQIMLMVARGGMLVILAGILPLTAAATNTEAGRTWFKRSTGWLIAWLLYKPAAAIVYAAAFHLAGTDVFKDDGTGLISLLTGLMLMILAIVALPALMKFVTPAVASMASGGNAGLAAAAMVAPAIGAISTGGGHSDPSASTPPPSTPPSNAPGADTTGGPHGPTGTQGPPGGSPTSSPDPPAGGGSTPSSSGGTAGGAGTAAGATAAGVGVAAEVGKQGVEKANEAAQGAADSSTSGGEGT